MAGRSDDRLSSFKSLTDLYTTADEQMIAHAVTAAQSLPTLDLCG